MGLFDAYNNYNALSPEEKGIIEKKAVDAALPPDAWIASLGALAKYDVAGDSSRKVFGCGGIIAIILGFVGMVILHTWIVFAFFAVIGGVGLYMWAGMRKRDVPNILREFVLPLVAVLREDLNADESLRLKVDMRGGTAQEKKIRTQVLRDSGYPKISESHYVDSWMEGEGSLVDGTVISWDVVDNIRERSVTKRNPRGKIKQKVKYKIKRVITARVGMRKASYGMASASEAGMLMKSGDKRNVIRLRRQFILTQINQNPDIAEILGLITDVYKRATPAQSEGN